jgi:hypothetical protein
MVGILIAAAARFQNIPLEEMVLQVLSPDMQNRAHQYRQPGASGRRRLRTALRHWGDRADRMGSRLFCSTTAESSCRNVKTSWKYGTGSSSAERAARHLPVRCPGTRDSADDDMNYTRWPDVHSKYPDRHHLREPQCGNGRERETERTECMRGCIHPSGYLGELRNVCHVCKSS